MRFMLQMVVENPTTKPSTSPVTGENCYIMRRVDVQLMLRYAAVVYNASMKFAIEMSSFVIVVFSEDGLQSNLRPDFGLVRDDMEDCQYDRVFGAVNHQGTPARPPIFKVGTITINHNNQSNCK